MHSKAGNATAMHRDGSEVDKGGGFEDADVSVIGGADEVAGEGWGEGAGVKGEGGYGAGVIDEGSNLRGSCEIVDFDGIIGAAGCRDGSGGGEGLDRGDVRGVGEERV